MILNQNKPKILIVDDDEAFIEMYKDVFTSHGFKVLKAKDGEEALSVAIEEEPDLILLDIMMPKINGFNVLDIIKATPKTSHIPVVVITAFIKEDYEQHALRSGAAEFISKAETTPDKLIEAIERVITYKKG